MEGRGGGKRLKIHHEVLSDLHARHYTHSKGGSEGRDGGRHARVVVVELRGKDGRRARRGGGGGSEFHLGCLEDEHLHLVGGEGEGVV